MNLKGTTIRNWARRLRKSGLRNVVTLFLNQKRETVYRLRHRGNSFLLRGRSVDFHVFNSIFGEGEYDFDIGFVPEVIVDAGAYTGFSGISTGGFRRQLLLRWSLKHQTSLLVRNTSPFDNIRLCRGHIYA